MQAGALVQVKTFASVVAGVAVSSMFGAAYLTLMPAFARDILHGHSTAYGTLMTSVGECSSK